MPETRIAAEPRTEFGKGAARRVRRANKVPAVLYGHGEKPTHISLPGHDLALALRRDPNVLLTLAIDGGDQLAVPRAIVRDPIKGFLEHVDLLIVRRGERITIDLSVSITGDTAPDTLPTLAVQSISVEAEATNLPEAFEISVDDMAAGSQITAADLKLPEGVTLVTDPETIVVSVAESTLAAEVAEIEAEAEAAAEEAAAEAGEGEESAERQDGAGQADAAGATEVVGDTH